MRFQIAFTMVVATLVGMFMFIVVTLRHPISYHVALLVVYGSFGLVMMSWLIYGIRTMRQHRYSS